MLALNARSKSYEAYRVYVLADFVAPSGAIVLLSLALKRRSHKRRAQPMIFGLFHTNIEAMKRRSLLYFS
ncbi:hypothetical protein [Tolypothrix sp. NIES-4075]|uniref:hypothetical protein n=1 Tax=Tolypothrix sp. NIES-4075 TaxID=2005459 RepID=UPI001180D579|nr:hypothetical protein [Tolypothrix sp. NIES-4075]